MERGFQQSERATRRPAAFVFCETYCLGTMASLELVQTCAHARDQHYPSDQRTLAHLVAENFGYALQFL